MNATHLCNVTKQCLYISSLIRMYMTQFWNIYVVITHVRMDLYVPICVWLYVLRVPYRIPMIQCIDVSYIIHDVLLIQSRVFNIGVCFLREDIDLWRNIYHLHRLTKNPLIWLSSLKTSHNALVHKYFVASQVLFYILYLLFPIRVTVIHIRSLIWMMLWR